MELKIRVEELLLIKHIMNEEENAMTQSSVHLTFDKGPQLYELQCNTIFKVPKLSSNVHDSERPEKRGVHVEYFQVVNQHLVTYFRTMVI